MVAFATLFLALLQCESSELTSQVGQHLLVARESTFDAFMEEHGRTYPRGSAEYEQRRQLFDQRSAEVAQWNSQPRLWTAVVNHLSDWTEEEKRSLYGYTGHPVRHSEVAPGQGSFLQTRRAIILAESRTWDNAILSVIDNQGSCGSCWAVAAAKMLEANYNIFTNHSRSFSAQELVNCLPNPHECGGTGGCKGATVELAMHYVSQLGLSTREETRYLGFDDSCTATGALIDRPVEWLAQPGVKEATSGPARHLFFSGWQRLDVNMARPLQEALMEATVAVSADASPWSSYGGGVFDSCPKDAVINHAILAIGYGTDSATGAMFWLIQNSWGSGWGENGRIKLLRSNDDGDHCGIDRKPQEGTACKDGPPEVRVCGMCGILYDNVIARFKP